MVEVACGLLGDSGGDSEDSSGYSNSVTNRRRGAMGCSILSSSSRTTSSEDSPNMSSRMGLHDISSHSSMATSRDQRSRS